MLSAPATYGDALVQLERSLISTLWTYTRWEAFDELNHKVAEGAFTPTPGLVPGEPLKANFCALVRLLSTGPGRPSTKYIHGISETSVQEEAAKSEWLAELADMAQGVEDLNFTDSDGERISGLLFRKWSWRRKVGTVV